MRAAGRDLITKSSIVVSICVLVITLITGRYRLVSGGKVLKALIGRTDLATGPRTRRAYTYTKFEQDPREFLVPGVPVGRE